MVGFLNCRGHIGVYGGFFKGVKWGMGKKLDKE